MPELPEVEATRDNLARWTVGRRVVAVARVDATLAPSLEALAGRTFERWERRGKVLAGVAGEPVLRSHLGMTGRWVRDPAPERPHQRLALTLDDGHRVAWLDVRRLGEARMVGSTDEAFVGLGPDAWVTPPTPEALARALGGGQSPLKACLLDQARLAGLGNIAVVEACFRARLHPHVAIARVDTDGWRRLVAAIHEHLAATLAGTVGLDEIRYVSEGGDNPFLVYGRADEPCPVCRSAIVRAALAGRPTFYCPHCQSETR